MAAPRVRSSVAPNHQRRARGWTDRKCCFSRYGPTRNRTQPTSTGGACSTKWTTKPVPIQNIEISNANCMYSRSTIVEQRIVDHAVQMYETDAKLTANLIRRCSMSKFPQKGIEQLQNVRVEQWFPNCGMRTINGTRRPSRWYTSRPTFCFSPQKIYSHSF